MKIRILPLPFYMGLSVLFISTLFKIQHWPGGQLMFFGGSVQESVFTVLLLTEIGRSKKADSKTKVIWGVFYLVLLVFGLLFLRGLLLLPYVFFAGISYLQYNRKKFYNPPKVNANKIQFDSIDV